MNAWIAAAAFVALWSSVAIGRLNRRVAHLEADVMRIGDQLAELHAQNREKK